MHSEATARKAASSETATLEYYRVRDETMRAYQPATDEERMLATNIARTWFRLQQYYELESQLLSGRGLLDLFNNDPDRYKLLTRSIADAERIWRKAVEMFKQARRRREAASLESPRRRNVSTIGSHRPPAPHPAPVPAAPDSREPQPAPPLSP